MGFLAEGSSDGACKEAEVRAARIRFSSGAAFSDPGLRQPNDREQGAVELEIEDPEKIVESQGPYDSAAELQFLFIDSAWGHESEWPMRARAWMVTGPPGEPFVDLVHRSDQILWRPGRAVLVGSVERVDENSAALIEFALHEAALREIESDVESAWPAADRDVCLVREVDGSHLRRRGHVNVTTERIVRGRIRFARLERRLEHPSALLAPHARRLVTELAVAVDVPDRLRALDDQLEVLEDLYELANDRLSEFSYFNGEKRLEMLVIGLLAVEVVLLILELIRLWN